MKPSKTSIPIIGVGSVPSGSTKGAVDITLRSNHSEDQIELHAHVLQSLTVELPPVVIASQSWNHISDLELADPDHLSPGRIDVLIGADFYGLIIKPGVITGKPGQPIAIQTVFGWAVLGPAGPSSSTSPAHQGHLISNLQLHELVSKFWEQEEVPASHQESLSAEEAECEAHFIATHSRDSSGRYIVRLPFKPNAPPLGYSKALHNVRYLAFSIASPNNQIFIDCTQSFSPSTSPWVTWRKFNRQLLQTLSITSLITE
ncbi:uncharacterized protein LOC123264019 [Cotesia glomerata]|uniref:uncharacterized protein LOC123264019 n=1 Tax=Cotesia glomerata TaxID=32391 RepID=UPI001D0260B4|nr:uncharacterized protein LOC123264019 [Cotesia glomerata]